jgi:hypothetical protein
MVPKKTKIKKFLSIFSLFSLLFFSLLCKEVKRENDIQKVEEIQENKTNQNLNEDKIEEEKGKMEIDEGKNKIGIDEREIELEFMSSKLVFVKM